jgi:plastocyanin
MGFALSAVVASGVEPADPLAGDAKLVSESMSFEPEELVVTAGSGIWMENRDGVRHTFTVEGTDLDLNVPGDSAGRTDLDLDPGTYQVICGVPGHEAMSMQLTITEESQ